MDKGAESVKTIRNMKRAIEETIDNLRDTNTELSEENKWLEAARESVENTGECDVCFRQAPLYYIGCGYIGPGSLNKWLYKECIRGLRESLRNCRS